MGIVSEIRILESDKNRRGDLFGRLMKDLFHALGYDKVRLNIHKSGREIDLEAEHRTELRCVTAECKATEERIGGDEVNKFAGALDVEKRKKPDNELVGYYISLAGFTETAVEQEREAGGKRLVLLTGQRIIEELIQGHIVVQLAKAMERAGRCAAAQSPDLVPENECELLAHDLGWILTVYFTQYGQRTHFALIHADGVPLAAPIANSIVNAEKAVGGSLHKLKYLPPPPSTPSIPENDLQEAQDKYYEYLASECGEVPLEGLPADQDVGTRHLSLESIFVPLHLEPADQTGDKPARESPTKMSTKKLKETDRISTGQVLSKCARLAVLAAPGGGKTMLLKRLATAYAFPARRKLIKDCLPDRTWLPVYMRCRQLGEMALKPIGEILRAMPQRAEMDIRLATAFAALVERALQSGELLLLVDGLDEIADESTRMAFIMQLRTFLAVYPAIGVVVTSREAGFRVVGGALSSECEHYKISDFENDDITRLTIEWHKVVVGNKPDVIAEAGKLAKVICKSDRVRRLAVNPLLLTTLLLVKRWVGQLPTRRSVLYGKAIDVLLMTWNVEGYQPIELDEAIPQLAFIAFVMMKKGVQRISSRTLEGLLLQARKQMPEVLGYARFSVAEFVQRIELRSSLLIQSGFALQKGTLYPTYEYRHLTFQEYLAAKAVVEGYYPGRKESDTIFAVLKPHLNKREWREVVRLAAVLAGRKAEPLVRYLVKLCKQGRLANAKLERLSYLRKSWDQLSLLSDCIVDEVQLAPALLEEALEIIARTSRGPSFEIAAIAEGKYGKLLRSVVEKAFISSETDLPGLGSALAEACLSQDFSLDNDNKLSDKAKASIREMLRAQNPLTKSTGALVLMEKAFEAAQPSFRNTPPERWLGDEAASIIKMLPAKEPYVAFSACWALAWLGRAGFLSPENTEAAICLLVVLWRKANLPEVQRQAAWAISELPPVSRNPLLLSTIEPGLEDFLKSQPFPWADHFGQQRMRGAALVLAYYLGAPWSDDELLLRAKKVDSEFFEVKGKSIILRNRHRISRVTNRRSKLASQTEKR